MISLACTKCSTLLNVDDGFAGGVCRCSACGTIQTVPAKGQSARAGEAIFERRPRGATSAPSSASSSAADRRDLDALGDVVTRNGLAGNGASREAGGNSNGSASGNAGGGRRATSAGTPHAPPRPSRAPVLAGIVAAGMVAALAGVGAVLWIGSRPPVTDAGRGAADGRAAADAGTPAAVSSFGPIPLDSGGTVVYLLDRGDATRAYTAALRAAVLRSARSLGAGRTFQVRYWSVDGVSPGFPPAPAEPTAATLATLEAWMTDVPGGTATDALDSFAHALRAAPAEVVLVTGKAWQLDDAFADDAARRLDAMPARPRVHAIALGGSAGSDALRRLATRTGGTYLEADAATLATFGE